MEWLRMFGARLRNLFRKRQLDGDLDAEFREHLEMLTEENLRKGMAPQEARYAARREFGGVEQTREDHKQLRSLPAIENLPRDLRLGLPMLGSNPRLTPAPLLTLTL